MHRYIWTLSDVVVALPGDLRHRRHAVRDDCVGSASPPQGDDNISDQDRRRQSQRTDWSDARERMGRGY